MVNGADPEVFIEGHGQGAQFTQLKHHAANSDGVRFHFVPLFLQCRQFGFGFFKAAAQLGVGGAVGFFARSVGSVFRNAQSQHLGDGGQFIFQSLNVCIDEVRIRKHPLGIAELLDGSVPVGKICPKSFQEQFLQPLLGQMGRFAFVFSLELAVALPDDSAVAVGGVPGLSSENIAAIPTDDLPGKGAGLTVPIAAVFAPFQLRLHLLPCPRLDDGGVAVLHIVLGNLSLIDLGFLGEKIHREGLLEQSGAFVLFISQNALHGGSLPNGLFPGSGDSLFRQHGGDGIGGFPLEELAVDAFDNLRLLRNDFRQSVSPFSVAQELTVGNADLSVREPLPLPPGHIFGDTAAFLLGQTGHDGDEQIPFGIEGHDVLFFKKALTSGFLQFADGGQAVHSVSCEAAHALGHDQVDFFGKGILHHTVEAVPMLGIDGADALVRVDLHEIPVQILLNELGVVVHLGFVGSELFLTVRGDTGVSRNPVAHLFLCRSFGMDVQCSRDHGHVLSSGHGIHSFLLFSDLRLSAFLPSSFPHGSGHATV